MNKEELIQAKACGERLDFLFFWGHRPVPGPITKSCLSQWYEAPFVVDGVRYLTAEHYMMARKAELFGDMVVRNAIIEAADPGKAKALGRRVSGFDEERWIDQRLGVVTAANMHKFSLAPRLKRFLLDTGDKVLVEASPLDLVWGTGLAADAPEAGEPCLWPGLNLLGFALMHVRATLRAAIA